MALKSIDLNPRKCLGSKVLLLKPKICLFIGFSIAQNIFAFSISSGFANAEPAMPAMPFDGELKLKCGSDGLQPRVLILDMGENQAGGKGEVSDASLENAQTTPLRCERFDDPKSDQSTLYDFGRCFPERNLHLQNQHSYVMQWGGFAQSFSVMRFLEDKPEEFFSCVQTLVP